MYGFEFYFTLLKYVLKYLQQIIKILFSCLYNIIEAIIYYSSQQDF